LVQTVGEVNVPKTTNPGLLTKLLSSAMFSAFLSDLGKLTATGLTKPECDRNKDWLDGIADAVAAIPEPETGKRILDRCWEIKEVYDHWNYPEHQPAVRAELRKKLQDKVSKLSTTFAKRTELLEKNLDMLVYRKYYDVTEELVEALPDKLTEMRKTLSRFPHMR
jgi:hypothetical protein